MGFMQKLRFSLQRRNEPTGWRRRSKDPTVRLNHCLGNSAFSVLRCAKALINIERKFTSPLEAHANRACETNPGVRKAI
jgi:hypothetical protein